jgi:hypothetical protein
MAPTLTKYENIAVTLCLMSIAILRRRLRKRARVRRRATRSDDVYKTKAHGSKKGGKEKISSQKTQCHCKSFCRRYGFPKIGWSSIPLKLVKDFFDHCHYQSFIKNFDSDNGPLEVITIKAASVFLYPVYMYQWSHFLKEHHECCFVHSKIISELVRVFSVPFFKKCIICASLFPSQQPRSSCPPSPEIILEWTKQHS